MSPPPDDLVGKRILIVGLGGLGCPASLALAGSGATLVLADDDLVEESNLHRQLLYDVADIGRDKLDAARSALLARGCARDEIELVRSRFLPHNALDLAASVDLVLEGADNYATKFLAADACHLTSTPVVHGAAVRWQATVWAVGALGKPCYRCLFEDVPAGPAQSCDSAGVMGPVVGIAGALMAELAHRQLAPENAGGSELISYDGLRDQLRAVTVPQRESCPLCGPEASIRDTAEARYLHPVCAA